MSNSNDSPLAKRKAKSSSLTPSLKERKARGTLKVTEEMAARDPKERGRVGLTPLRPPETEQSFTGDVESIEKIEKEVRSQQ